MKDERMVLSEKAVLTLEIGGELSLVGKAFIEHYSEKEIRMTLEKNSLCVKGERMSLGSYYRDDVRITGDVYEISLKRLV